MEGNLPESFIPLHESDRYYTDGTGRSTDSASYGICGACRSDGASHLPETTGR